MGLGQVSLWCLAINSDIEQHTFDKINLAVGTMGIFPITSWFSIKDKVEIWSKISIRPCHVRFSSQVSPTGLYIDLRLIIRLNNCLRRLWVITTMRSSTSSGAAARWILKLSRTFSDWLSLSVLKRSWRSSWRSWGTWRTPAEIFVRFLIHNW